MLSSVNLFHIPELIWDVGICRGPTGNIFSRAPTKFISGSGLCLEMPLNCISLSTISLSFTKLIKLSESGSHKFLFYC